MSSEVRTQSVSFPDQLAIIAYINAHPLKASIDTPVITVNFPQSLEKVSARFAKQTMDKNKIEETLKPIFEKEQTERFELLSALASLAIGWEKIDNGKPTSATESIKDIHEKNTSELNTYIRIVVTIYKKALTDLSDNAWYTPPAPGETTFQRHVEQVNKT